MPGTCQGRSSRLSAQAFTSSQHPWGYHTRVRLGPLDFVPQANALAESYIFFHEVLGTVWYRLKFDLGR